MTKKASPPRFPAMLAAVPRAIGAPAVQRPLPVLRPQRTLHEAALSAVQRAVPSGVGLDSSAVRTRMVQRLRLSGIGDERVLTAFGEVPRHRFVDTALAGQAYEDTSLPIGLRQTISKPSVVARMLSLLFDGDNARTAGHLGRVMEIGTGCGYQTALLSRMSTRVLSIERLKGLHDKARENLVGLRSGDVRLVLGDGRLGHVPRAPYDTIVAAAGGEDVPTAWLDQLDIGGRLIAPVHDAASAGQVLVVIDRRADGWHRRAFEGVHFVPLKSGIE